MCDEAIINGIYVDDIGSLTKALGGTYKVILDADSAPHKEDYCLCSVNWEETAKHHNMKMIRHTWENGYGNEFELTSKR